MFPRGVAQNTNVSPALSVRMARKKSMMYVIINSNVSLVAAIKTLTNARPSWIASKSAKEIQTARLGAAQ